MKKINYHLCVVSGQATPNLVPLIEQNADLPVDQVILIYTQGFKEKAQNLQTALKNYQIKTELREVNTSENLEELKHYFQSLWEELSQQNIKLYCNLTGGTKPMSIALHELAMLTEGDGSEAYYLNLDGSLSWYQPKDRPNTMLTNRVKLKDFLTAHGLSLVKTDSQIHPEWRPLIDEMMHGFDLFKKVISNLNAISTSESAQKKLVSEINSNYSNPNLDKLLDLFEQHNLITLEGTKINFASEEARFFCAGGWLEEHTYHVVRQLMSKTDKIKEVEHSVKVKSIKERNTNVKNELDVAVLANNRLFIMECKTYKTKGENHVQESLYKLLAISKQIGGLLGKGMLISLNDLSEENKERAKLYGIDVISGEKIKNLSQNLRNKF